MFGWNRSCILTWGLFLLATAGCGDGSAPAEGPPPAPSAPADTFDPATAGSIRGQVSWAGAVPTVKPLLAPINPLTQAAGEQRKLLWDNPNLPKVDPSTHAVANAVVFLRGVEPRRAKPWDHPPVQVEQRDYTLHVQQGNTTSAYGFVRRGDRAEMVSRQSVFHALRAGGAAFFTLTFPDPDRSLSRPLSETGVVELTSAAGYFWMRAYLFVDDHPYFARTDAAGRFALDRLAPGRYEVVCWLPNWHEARRERDPETNLISRLTFHPPYEAVQLITVGPRQTCATSFTVEAADFRH